MKPMMKCGHAANATTIINGISIPCCVICAAIAPGAYEVQDSVPDLQGRMASCSYKGSCRERHGRYRDTIYGTFDETTGHAFAPSSTDLPFFEHSPKEQFDLYFCGCLGWD
jgi:hypothetical protein